MYVCLMMLLNLSHCSECAGGYLALTMHDILWEKVQPSAGYGLRKFGCSWNATSQQRHEEVQFCPMLLCIHTPPSALDPYCQMFTTINLYDASTTASNTIVRLLGQKINNAI